MNISKNLTAAFLVLLLSFYGVPANGADAGGAEDAADKIPVVNGPEIWKDPSQPIEARVRDLVSRMTLREKASEVCCEPVAIPRLGVPCYSYRNECLHGVATGIATVFPEPIGMAATWDTPLIHQEGDVISTEARAIHNNYVLEHHQQAQHRFGLTFYSPNLNLVRDPRWGRDQETYGEDPFLISEMGVAYITGLQGDNPKYIKIIACAKHYAVHSGPEPLRHTMDMRPSQRDLYETYLPAFEAAVREAHVGSVMGAYSALYGIPDCASPFLLTDVLRKQWGFDGFVISDGGAIWDIWAQHKYVKTPEAAAAAAVKAGCDMSSGNMAPTREILKRTTDWSPDAMGWVRGGAAFDALPKAVEEGLISEKQIDVAAERALTARFRVGLFDPPAMDPWSKLTIADDNTPEHRALAEKVAEESIVLLKNDGLLPLNREKIKRIAVIGPNADSVRMLLGNYHGVATNPVTILKGIRDLAGTGIDVVYAKGCPLALRRNGANKPTAQMLSDAIAAAKSADVVIYVGGIDSTLESEEARILRNPFDGFNRGDRTRIELPAVQEEMLKSLEATGKPVVFINCSGTAMAIPWAAKHLPAIIQAWYPGEEGGTAVARVLFGQVNPAGRLPVTFYESTKDLPPFEDYSMANRTYRYYTGKPLYAFGYGLSYTKFKYSDMKVGDSSYSPTGTVRLSFTVKNTGKRTGDEVAQVYFRQVHSPIPQPRLALCGFTRVHLAPGKSIRVSVDVPSSRLHYWDTEQKQYVVAPGKYELMVGAASDDIRLHSKFSINNPG